MTRRQRVAPPPEEWSKDQSGGRYGACQTCGRATSLRFRPDDSAEVCRTCWTAPVSGDTPTVSQGDAAWLLVLLDNAVPRESGGPMDWEGEGRAHAEAILRPVVAGRGGSAS